MADFEYIGDIESEALPEAITGADRVYSGLADALALPEAITGADRAYVGDIEAQAIPEGVSAFNTWSYIGDITASAIPEATIDRPLSYTGLVIATVDSPNEDKVQVTTYPYLAYAVVQIDGYDYSPIIASVVSVNRQSDTAASFSVKVMSSLKPSSFLNKEIKFAVQSADETGTIISTFALLVGVIKQVNYDADTKEYTLAGYDYGGKHGTKGDFLSANITPVLFAQVLVETPGSITTGQNPIWAVTVLGDEFNLVVDGRDYFVNPLTGVIEIPLGSAAVGHVLQYSYAEFFPSMADLMQDIVGRKGWTLQFDGMSLDDYTTPKAQPVLTLSDESVIDIARKFAELSGARIDTSQFPYMRLYSDIVNYVSIAPVIFDEDSIFENTLKYSINLESVITDQTVKSAAKPFPNIEISDFETIADESGLTEWRPVYTALWATESSRAAIWDRATAIYAGLGPIQVAEVRVKIRAINTVSLIAGGDFFWRTPTFTSLGSITAGDWVETPDGDEMVYTLSIDPVLSEEGDDTIQIIYPGAQWTLQIDAKQIAYGEGTLDEIVSISHQRTIDGVAETLAGDVYEHPYLETQAQAENLADAILFEAGNFYQATFETPIHKGTTLNVGTSIQIYQDNIKQFIGVINNLGYNINYQGASHIRVSAKGIGKSI